MSSLRQIVSKALKAVQAAFKRNSITRRVPFSKSEPAGFLANALRNLVTSRDWALRDSAVETLTVYVEACHFGNVLLFYLFPLRIRLIGL
jgi:hypothetical protein